jgi:hypothetical protein
MKSFQHFVRWYNIPQAIVEVEKQQSHARSRKPPAYVIPESSINIRFFDSKTEYKIFLDRMSGADDIMVVEAYQSPF